MTPLLLLWFGFIVSTGAHLEKRVIGGQPCELYDRHYHVRLSSIDSDGTTSFCGGSLISDRWILTAAHCWIPGSTTYAVVGVHPGPGQRVEIISAPRIYRDTSNRMHDIMLLQLPYPTNIPHVNPPNCTHKPTIGDSVSIAGHAATTNCSCGQRKPGESRNLHCGSMTIVDCGMPQPLNLWHNPPLDVFQFCGQRTGVDACFGDSGGGVVYNNMIYGVISNIYDYPCSSPAGFVDICHLAYYDFIGNTIHDPTTMYHGPFPVEKLYKRSNK